MNPDPWDDVHGRASAAWAFLPRRVRLALREQMILRPVERRRAEPLYLKASGEWAGKGTLPTRAGVPRPDPEPPEVCPLYPPGMD